VRADLGERFHSRRRAAPGRAGAEPGPRVPVRGAVRGAAPQEIGVVMDGAALDFLHDHVAVDVHSHAGPNGISSKTPPSDALARGMRAGGVAVVCLADVPDGPLLARDAANVLRAQRAPKPGELYQHHLGRLAWVDELIARHGIRRALTAADVKAAHAAGEPAIILDIEGLDFLEQK